MSESLKQDILNAVTKKRLRKDEMNMTKVKFFSNSTQFSLEQEVNSFIQNKNIISISYSTHMVGYSIKHCCCVTYIV